MQTPHENVEYHNSDTMVTWRKRSFGTCPTVSPEGLTIAPRHSLGKARSSYGRDGRLAVAIVCRSCFTKPTTEYLFQSNVLDVTCVSTDEYNELTKFDVP